MVRGSREGPLRFKAKRDWVVGEEGVHKHLFGSETLLRVIDEDLLNKGF